MGDWLGYTRVSRVGDRAERLISPEVQAERIKAYASSRGLTVHMLDPELDVSGGTVERPILSQAIAAIERGEAAGIIVAQLDRLSRMDITDALHTIRRIESAGAQVIAVAENFDVATAEGRMGRTVALAMGEMQLDRYKAQFREAKQRAVGRGVWPMPIVPAGYRRGEDRRLEPDPERAPLIVRAFEMRAGGASWAPIAELLGKGLTGARKVIINRVYLGEINLGEWRNPAAHPPLVSRELWEAAQIVHPPPPRSTQPPALLAGLVRCASCGFKMSVSESIYRCRPVKAAGRCPAPAITSKLRLEELVSRTVEAHVASATVTATEATDALAAAKVELASAEDELALYQQATRVADVGVEHFSAGMRERTEEVERKRRAVAKAQLALPPPNVVPSSLSSERERHALRRSLGVVWVYKDRRRAKVRIVAAGFEPSEFGPIPWSDLDMPGEIRPLGPE